MKVYKFGGASVKDADAVRNLYSLIKDEIQNYCGSLGYGENYK